jgi:hypothetical protein
MMNCRRHQEGGVMYVDDDEYVRYLASYIIAHQGQLIEYSFDRTASHSEGEYREYVLINQERLEEIIKEFMERLP